MACLTPALVSLSTKSSPQDLERAQGNSCGKLLQGFPYERRMPHRNFLGRETALEFSLYPPLASRSKWATKKSTASAIDFPYGASFSAAAIACIRSTGERATWVPWALISALRFAAAAFASRSERNQSWMRFRKRASDDPERAFRNIYLTEKRIGRERGISLPYDPSSKKG
jgi:hypothetical protein